MYTFCHIALNNVCGVQLFSYKIHIDKYIGKEYNMYSKISRVTGRYKGDFFNDKAGS